eukprot:gb/GECH01004080.1/.p1 GENE.gb/GECH01004080.1/~~gb/GECH01004080.1/.p1  ORF type:complete len:232 (+),score=42.82 gb/GECH01004080.1/:1-696(+)
MESFSTAFLTPTGRQVIDHPCSLSPQFPFYNIVLFFPPEMNNFPPISECTVTLFLRNRFNGKTLSFNNNCLINTITLNSQKRMVILHRVRFFSPVFDSWVSKQSDAESALHFAVVHKKTERVCVVSSPFTLSNIQHDTVKKRGKLRLQFLQKNDSDREFFQRDKMISENLSPEIHRFHSVVEKEFERFMNNHYHRHRSDFQKNEIERTEKKWFQLNQSRFDMMKSLVLNDS